MPNSLDIQSLVLQRDELKAQLAAIGDMRPGSLVPRFRRCGKPSCHCAKKNDPGHGPSYSLTHAVAGKTVTHVIPSDAVERTREQLEEYHRFRQLIQRLLAVSEQICQWRVREAKPESEEFKKNRVRRPARR
jgi:hypothetical protein